MRPTAPGDATRRVFAALVPPPELARDLTAAAAEALAPVARGLRFYPPEHVHLTLCFLGAVPEQRLDALGAALGRAAADAGGPLALRVGGGGGFPSADAARVAWVGVADGPVDGLADGLADRGRPGALAALRAGVEHALAAAGVPPVDRGRPFRPHLTLARARAPLALPPAFGGLAFQASWTARELLLVESRLDRPGPERYPVLVARALGGA